MSSLVKDIYDKVQKGDALTDHEVFVGIQFFGNLSFDLGQLGDTFKLAANELRIVSQKLRDMQDARFERVAMNNMLKDYEAIHGTSRRKSDTQ